MAGKVTIEVFRGAELLGESVFEVGQRIAIGRLEESDIRLNDKQISRNHADAVIGEDGLLIVNYSASGCVFGDKVETGTFRVPFGIAFGIGRFDVLARNKKQGIAEMESADLRRQVLRKLIDSIDLSKIETDRRLLKPRVESALRRILHDMGVIELELRESLTSELADEALGLGPLEALLKDDTVSEIMVVDADTVYVERNGRLANANLRFSSPESIRVVMERIVTPLGRRIDEASPMVDARLPDGSRVNAIIPPLAVKGPCITIRKFSKTPLKIGDLIRLDAFDEEVASFLIEAVRSKMNIVISGGTGSGKTTLLNVLACAIPKDERIITIEDAAELKLHQPHVVTLETRPPNAEGRGEVTIRDLVRNALRMRPDRIVVGECRGKEALDMLQAMNTGHDGSLTTTHANSPVEAMARLETLCLMAGIDLPSRAIRDQIAGAIDLVVQQSRMDDGKRRITSISEVTGIEDNGEIKVKEVYRSIPASASQHERKHLIATGWIPEFYKKFADNDISVDVGDK